MNDPQSSVFTAFVGSSRLASGSISQVALAVKNALAHHPTGSVLIYDDRSGRAIDIDTRGSEAEVLARLAAPTPEPLPRGRGRPKLGVVAREVTLLPRHWAWLGSQPGGASVAIRKLVEAARRTNQEPDQRRERREAAFQFIWGMAGNLANFDAANRALFANDRARFSELIRTWPADVRDHAIALAFG
jgi:hypothetical protein